MQLKPYQETAIDDLLDKANKLLGLPGNKKLVFKSPTGSGKTIMMAEFLKQLVDDPDIKQPYGFVWTAPRQLHDQSHDKLEKYFDTSRAIKCSYFEDLDDRKIGQNEILFFNWESINREDNIYIRDNEQEFNLSKVIERAKANSLEIILVIDEAHHHATSDISQGLIEMISPKLTIEVSATPVMQGDLSVDVLIDDVKRDGMIKKAVVLNDNFDNSLENGKITTQKLSGSSEELVLDAAIKKRDELVEEFKKESVEINPLILIQLPDRTTSLEDRIRERVESILKDKYGISTEKGNNKLAIWLSGEHTNKENVERGDSEVEVLIFKQAIALGWDCPRAQILVLFREWHSPVFSIQTVGRIMRMPEPDMGHYPNDLLNYGYIYTNLDNVEIHDDIARDYITIYKSRRRKDYEPLNLTSYYPKRHREKTRLSPFFTRIFLEKAEEYGLKSVLDLKSKKIDLKIISEYKAENIDLLVGTKLVGDKSINISKFDLQKIFDYFIRNHLSPYYPEERSVNRVKESIYKFFGDKLDMPYMNFWQDIVETVLSESNSRRFIDVLDKAKESYKSLMEKKDAEMVCVDKWNVPEILSFNENYKEEPSDKSIMQPFYSDGRWKPEVEFINLLNSSESVDWWFKNGDRDATYFAVPYGEDKEIPFYVDFIVKFKDGKIGLFDTKSGITSKVAGPKVDGLNVYFENENKKGRKLFGGIVTNTGRDFRGRWVYFDKSGNEMKDNLFDNWKDLKI